MNTQGDKAEQFLNLHQRDGILVLPNAFDVVSACLMAETGFEAVATTSGGCAFRSVTAMERIYQDKRWWLL